MKTFWWVGGYRREVREKSVMSKEKGKKQNYETKNIPKRFTDLQSEVPFFLSVFVLLIFSV